MYSSSKQSENIGIHVDGVLAENKIDDAAAALYDHFDDIIDGIDEKFRGDVKALIIKKMTE